MGETTIGALLARDGGNVKTGPFGTTLKAKEYSKEGVPLISVGEIGYGALRIKESTPRAPPEVVERLPEYVLQAGDIVFGRKGAVDRLAMVKPEQAGWFLGSDGIRLRLPSTCDARFIAYQLQGHEARSWLLQHATGTTMASLNQSTIERLPIVLPPLADQRAIAYILGTLDDKIELNRRMNETLEASARALFKAWFVDFDPVRAKMEGRHTGLPQDIADLFPDRLVNSEMGKIPEGWEVFRLDQLANHHTKTTSPSRFSGLEYEHFSIPAYDAGQRPAIELGAAIRSNKTVVLKDAVLLSKLNPRIARVWVPADSTARPQICSTEFLVFTPRSPANRNLLFTLFGDQRFRTLLESLVTGTSNSHQRVPPKALKAREVLTGSPRAFTTFGEVIGGTLARILKNRSEAATLAALRDTLLPKLISGEIRVPNAERALESVT